LVGRALLGLPPGQRGLGRDLEENPIAFAALEAWGLPSKITASADPFLEGKG
jgi:hypothetical protein